MQECKLLIIDDTDANGIAMAATLSSLQVVCHHANTLDTALEHLLNHTYAMILLDINMPDSNGFDTAKIIRERQSTRDTPIVFMTANTLTQSDMLKSYSAGAVDCISMPLHPDILIQKVSVFLDLFKLKQAAIIQSLQQAERTHNASTQTMEYQLTNSAHSVRRLSQRLMEVQEEEHTRLSGVVHDQLGQLLASIKISMDWLQTNLSHSKAVDRCQFIQNAITESIKTCKDVVGMLRPPQLDTLGLEAAINDLISTMFCNSDIHVALTYTLLHTLPHQLNTHLFRIVQESLTNSLKHAKAKHIDIKLLHDGQYIVLTIDDDGVGFNDSDLEKHTFGVVGMKERLHAYDGSFKIENKTKGTGITVRVPQ
jgi:signal transduction histidine kinase